MSILENNLEQIARYNEHLAHRVRNHTSTQALISFEPTQSGDTTLVYNGLPVHCLENPQEEARRQFETVKNRGKRNIVVLIGLGLGYLFKRVYEGTECKIVVFEPNTDILRVTMESVDLAADLSSERVRVVDNTIQLTSTLNEVYSYKDELHFLSLPSALKLYPEEIGELQRDLPNITNLLQSNYVTMFEQSYKWLLNGLYNFELLKKVYPLSILEKSFAGKTALVVAPGPSLDKTIRVVEANREKFVIFCVNVAYRALAQHCIKPDFTIIIDNGQIHADTLMIEDLSGTNLVVTPTVHNKNFWGNNPDNRFVFYSRKELFSRWVLENTDLPFTEDELKGTASYLAMLSAYIMGCSKIIFTGQDLAYTDNKGYASGSVYAALGCGEKKLDQMSLNVSYGGNKKERYDKIISLKLKNYNRQSGCYVQGQNGDRIETSTDYANFIKYFEQFAIDNPDIELINCSTGGANIRGFLNRDLGEVVSDLPLLNCSVCNKVQELLLSPDARLGANPKFWDKIDTELDTVKILLQKHYVYVEEALGAAQALNKELKQYHPSYNKINKLISKLLKTYDLLAEIFEKNNFLIALCWKELTEFTMCLDQQNSEITLDSFQNIANSAETLFSRCKVTFKNAIKMIDERFILAD